MWLNEYKLQEERERERKKKKESKTVASMQNREDE